MPTILAMNFSKKNRPKITKPPTCHKVTKITPKDLRNAYMNSHGPETTIKYLKFDPKSLLT